MVTITPEIAGIAALLVWNSLESRNLRSTIKDFREDLGELIREIRKR